MSLSYLLAPVALLHNATRTESRSVKDAAFSIMINFYEYTWALNWTKLKHNYCLRSTEQFAANW